MTYEDAEHLKAALEVTHGEGSYEVACTEGQEQLPLGGTTVSPWYVRRATRAPGKGRRAYRKLERQVVEARRGPREELTS